MLMLDTTLECTEQPPLEQRCDFMDTRHDLVGLFGAGADRRDAVEMSLRTQVRRSLSSHRYEWSHQAR